MLVLLLTGLLSRARLFCKMTIRPILCSNTLSDGFELQKAPLCCRIIALFGATLVVPFCCAKSQPVVEHQRNSMTRSRCDPEKDSEIAVFQVVHSED